MSAVRGVRGAITVERDDAELLLSATERLLREIVAENGIDSDDVASALFTLTPDLISQFPAVAARADGLDARAVVELHRDRGAGRIAARDSRAVARQHRKTARRDRARVSRRRARAATGSRALVKGTTLGIAGIGLIGGSLALCAHAAGATVIGYDRDPVALRAATAAGAIDATARSIEELAERCTIVAIALPVDATIDVLAATPALARAEMVFDVASVKLPVVAAASGLPRFVASHPLAGRELGGFSAADGALFAGRTWAIVPALDPAVQARLEGLVTALGARPLIVTAADHDRLVAISSHLPQMLSVALGATLAAAGDADGRVYDLCGPGMQSMLRLAHSGRGVVEWNRAG